MKGNMYFNDCKKLNAKKYDASNYREKNNSVLICYDPILRLGNCLVSFNL